MLSKRARVWVSLITLLSLLSLASSCTKKEDGSTENDKQLKKYTSKNDEGSITGKISYSGTAPEAKKIATDSDPACGQKNPNLVTEEWVVKDGKVANTFVYIKSGTVGGTKITEYDGNSFPSAGKSAAVLDQNGCHYKPHVLGVMVNQDISITNSDPTTHNIHFTPSKNPDWNQSQPNGSAPLIHKLARAEVLVPVKCNQHPWMKSYIGVLKHPFFAVSGEDGSFEIKGVPPGKYTVVAWHEGGPTGSEKTMEVTVAAKTPATADFTFGGTTALLGQPGSLPMMPAIEFPMLNKH